MSRTGNPNPLAMYNTAGRSQDRISALPDAVLQRVLCGLTTVEVVRTSVLSTRWRHLWSSMPRLDFLDCDFYHENYRNGQDDDLEAINKVRMEKFARFVDIVLQRRDGSDLQSFRLCWDFFVDMRKVAGWVEYALGRRVKEADLAVSDYWDGMELPPALYTSPFLQVLKVAFLCMDSPYVKLVVPVGASLRRLHTLHLTTIPRDTHDPLQVESLQRLLSGCPLLESLRLDWCSYQFFIITREDLYDLDLNWRGCSALESVHMKRCPRRVLHINAPHLKWLTIKGTPCGNVSFQINAPALLSWHYTDCCFKVVHGDLPLLAVASISVQMCSPTILRGIYNVTFLTISCYFLKVVDVQGPSRVIPTFLNLKKLTLRAVLDFHDILYLLQQTPNLETLALENQNSYYGYRPREFKEEHWLVAASFEFLDHLKTFTINRFGGTKNEREFVKFLMSTARVLRNMHIVPERNKHFNNPYGY